jgi:hypothetical protein
VKESDIQFGLWVYLSRKGHGCITPNANLLVTGEMDMVSVMKSGKICEYEIKISRSDFKADFKKDKHRLIQLRASGITKEDHPSKWGVRVYTLEIKTANHFYYVAPEGLIAVDEVPKWAGLIEISNRSIFIASTVKRAPQIHSEIYHWVPGALGNKLMHRFWNLQRLIRNREDLRCVNCSDLNASSREF